MLEHMLSLDGRAVHLHLGPQLGRLDLDHALLVADDRMLRYDAQTVELHLAVLGAADLCLGRVQEVAYHVGEDGILVQVRQVRSGVLASLFLFELLLLFGVLLLCILKLTAKLIIIKQNITGIVFY